MPLVKRKETGAFLFRFLRFSNITYCYFFFQIKGIEEAEVTPGFVLCDPKNPIKTGTVFDAQVREKPNCAYL